jgi:hypothetical protein
MARLINFRSLVAESLETGDAINFQTILQQRLEYGYLKEQAKIAQSIHEENEQTPEDLGNALKSLGAVDPTYTEGVLTLTAPTKVSAQHISDYLDSSSMVASYEVKTELAKDTGSQADLEDLSSVDDIEYTFIVYLEPELVTYPDFVSETPVDSEEEPEEEPVLVNTRAKPMDEAKLWLSEANKSITIEDGIEKTTVSCPRGSRWDESKQRCVLSTVSENRKRFDAEMAESKKLDEERKEKEELKPSSKRINSKNN